MHSILRPYFLLRHRRLMLSQTCHPHCNLRLHPTPKQLMFVTNARGDSPARSIWSDISLRTCPPAHQSPSYATLVGRVLRERMFSHATSVPYTKRRNLMCAKVGERVVEGVLPSRSNALVEVEDAGINRVDGRQKRVKRVGRETSSVSLTLGQQ
jgi:hypothetical protein